MATTTSRRTGRPAENPEAREKQLIALATDLAEKQLSEGTASPLIIAHYLKLGTTEKQLELEKLKRENELLTAKTESVRSAKNSEELYQKAIEAFGIYRGGSSNGDP